jgi:hypothetical protein
MPACQDIRDTPNHPLNPFQKGPGSMDAIMNFLGNTWVMVGMAVALLALIGVMIFLRMKPRDE